MSSAPNIIAFQGVEGAYSHLSCRRVFPEMEAFACETFVEAMLMVDQGKSKLAMIPLENSTAGRVEEIYRLMPKSQLHIIGEHFEPVSHCLLGVKGGSIEQLKTVSSHPQALAQCDGHIKQLNIEPIAGFDTAGSAYELSQNPDPSHGAIASSLAAELYDLDILQENFQDVTGNTTRFLILSREEGIPERKADTPYITSLMFTVRNIPAALYKALGGFATNGINMVKLESYIRNGLTKGASFHLDVEGHPDDRMMQYALQELAFFTKEMRNLGTYEAHEFRTQNQFLQE
ncbi:prephenate dehydratase [Amphritea sp. 2_MG-2023]|jgi:prephenate dehydratase|uniref:prephenate dehydratase n=1 Tax=Amphritea TaxID=515417 RepID=UPI001C077718|nr:MULTISPECIES: prephenate dehydratase [Amphritea]MBU2965345.1 prephenate dehydratase [Amphritea atlantica]MDO6419990.1 prephenate dehydratase [Amphritea sp. 2_MG-2023]MDX2421805.1 prephenate dehydratase [Amphritea sp.]